MTEGRGGARKDVKEGRNTFFKAGIHFLRQGYIF